MSHMQWRLRLGRLGWMWMLLVPAGLVPWAAAQTLRVTPDHVMADQSAALQASGLAPREHVVIRAELVDGAGQRWRSEAELVADAAGAIDTGLQAPVKGSYKICSGLGLVWSMRPESHGTKAYRAPEAYAPQKITFHLVRGGATIADAELLQQFKADGVREIKLHGALHGSVFLPAGAGPWPGILVVGGEEGGMPVKKALWLASHGYAAIAVTYFGSDGLPDRLEHIPLEYFGRALAWMQGEPEIARGRLGVMGTSRGGELALELGAIYPAVRAVVAYAPPSVRYPGCCGRWLTAAWTLRGQGLEYLANTRPMGMTRGEADEAASIEVERTHGDILVVSGGQDGIWPSSLMTQELMTRLREGEFSHRFERLDYPHAGHEAAAPDLLPVWNAGLGDPQTGETRSGGGSAEANAESSMDANPKILRFLHDALMEQEEVASAAAGQSTP